MFSLSLSSPQMPVFLRQLQSLNRLVTANLPSMKSWPFLSRDTWQTARVGKLPREKAFRKYTYALGLKGSPPAGSAGPSAVDADLQHAAWTLAASAGDPSTGLPHIAPPN